MSERNNLAGGPSNKLVRSVRRVIEGKWSLTDLQEAIGDI